MQFVTSGKVTFNINWNKASRRGTGTDIKRIQIGAGR